MKLDWNPNIVTKLNAIEPDELAYLDAVHCQKTQGSIPEDGVPPYYRKMVDEFVTKYADAMALVGNKAPLAFRLSCEAIPVLKNTPLTAPMQIGGLPDLANTVNTMANYQEHLGKKPDLEAIIRQLWPKAIAQEVGILNEMAEHPPGKAFQKIERKLLKAPELGFDLETPEIGSVSVLG